MEEVKQVVGQQKIHLVAHQEVLDKEEMESINGLLVVAVDGMEVLLVIAIMVVVVQVMFTLLQQLEIIQIVS